MNNYKKREKKENIDNQKNGHKKFYPRDVDVFCVGNFLSDQLLVVSPFSLNENLVAGKLDHHDYPENNDRQFGMIVQK